ncbi:MAG TPA: AmmeMemoRadiSam system radical SAM enzyme [Candidatus Polarisedimenticolia bacterium]|nr:AmmeMemoRadiSam system radical SAM enzyme [Candidatus Polarisedimenticolia bacterium]
MPQVPPIHSRAPASARMAEARWWRPEEDGRVLCTLCPRYCHIGDGQAGFCYIRKNVGGRLYSLAYAQPCALQIDPIEKKPLFHFMPGARIFSMGTAGCNMGCKFCQNWEISKAREDQVSAAHLEPEEVVFAASSRRCPAIAFTYNEPTIWGEYVIDISKSARAAGIKTVMVTNGYVTPEALEDIYEWIDAANVDLKGFTEDFYRKVTLTHLEPVLSALPLLKKKGVWVEITTLLIPTLNDDMDEIRRLAEWVRDNMGAEQPLHFTAFHPDFKLTDLPSTSHELIHEARQTAIRAGLRHVYEGNVLCAEGSTTYCPGCGRALIRRSWQAVLDNEIVAGRCPCGRSIGGFFPEKASSGGMLESAV